jgi:phosphoribosylglycinamide formyltransferase 1
MKSIVVFASGAGSNAAAIIDYLRPRNDARVTLIVSNNPEAGVLGIAQREGIPWLVVDRTTFRECLFLEQLDNVKPDLIVLAGFLWKIPAPLIAAYPGKIINIHPALLPKYGGKGMYGGHVHEAVINAGEKESGITIHYVNEHYDKGGTIVQAHCPVLPADTPATLAARIHKLEHCFFPRTIEFLLSGAI